MMIDDIEIGPLLTTEDLPYHLLLDADPSKEMVDKHLAQGEIYVALLHNAIIGVYLLYIANRTAEIKNIAVDEQHQGKGIGKLLLADACSRAKKRGIKRMIICTGNSSIGQLYLYQKAGFDITGIKRNFFINNYPVELYENGIRVRHMIILSKEL